MRVRILTLLLAVALGAVGGALGHAAWAERARDTTAAAPPPSEVDPTPAADPADDVQPVNFVYRYLAPTSPELEEVATRVREADLLRRLPEVKWLDGLLLLPRTISYVATECGQPDAYYLPDKREVVLCYEMLQVLYEQGAELAESDTGIIDPEAEQADVAGRYVWANLRFIASHESGHALIDLLDLPVTGRQEDAVDQFATALMQRIAGEDESTDQAAENLRLAGHWFLARAETEFSLDAYADTHSLGLQRYFNLQCLLYGSDPERFAGIVARGDLPESRARTCPAEARRATTAWMRLLIPHLAPEYAMSEAEAEQWLSDREQTPHKPTRPATAPL